jgi:glycosyltransferase involved in cell wall biosynthesis
LGTPPAFTIEGVPVFVWLQGPPDTEREAIHDLRSMIVTTSGLSHYLSVYSYYQLRRLLDPFRGRTWDGIGCGSSWAADVLAQHGVPSRRTYAIPYPVDLETFSPDVHNDSDRSERPLILFVGRLDPRKRIDLVLDAFKRLSPRIPRCRLLIVGSLRYAKGQRLLIEQTALRHEVTYIKHLPHSDIPDLMRAATVLVQPSMNENFGSSVAEALACGTPVVVGRTNGTKDYISPDSVVIDQYAPTALADAIEGVIRRVQANGRSVQENARETAEQYFAPRRVAALLEMALQETISRQVED